MAAYECALAAKVLHHKSSREDNAEAQKMIDRALALDPDYAHAHAWRGASWARPGAYGWAADKDATFSEVKFELERAIALDDNDADVHRILAAIAIVSNEMTRARYHSLRIARWRSTPTTTWWSCRWASCSPGSARPTKAPTGSRAGQ